METVNSNIRPAVVALGIFDGVHLGHKKVLDAALEKAAEISAVPAVFTFRTETVTSKGSFKALMSEEQKCAKLKAYGFETLFSYDFSSLCDMSAGRFVKEILLEKSGAACAVCGEDFRFGSGGRADSSDLKRLCAGSDIEVVTVGQLKIDGEAVSSTRIRKLVERGDISAANRLSGHRFGYRLPVEHGFERGRTWDFPTINQRIPDRLVLPRFGVYCSKVLIDGRRYPGVTNIGVKPTVEKTSPPLAETFIIDFEGDLYGRTLDIELYEFVRPERVFPSFEELKAEIGRNTEFTRRYFKNSDVQKGL